MLTDDRLESLRRVANFSVCPLNFSCGFGATTKEFDEERFPAHCAKNFAIWSSSKLMEITSYLKSCIFRSKISLLYC